ncbi:hypothetical protein BDZ45DRAFT_692412 [Acephala macrosclerotiorum]|nr:hypothetical protein BDZ45DRAFT_692412 [Acephala macrosclerotiorum]
MSLILMAGSMFFHESPRWLLLTGREDKARKSFARFYDKSAEPDNISWQILEVNQPINFERDTARSTSWMETFRGLDDRQTHIALLVLLGNALIGIQFVIPYAALFLEDIGLKNPYLSISP